MTSLNGSSHTLARQGSFAGPRFQAYLAVLLTGLFLLVMPTAQAAQVDWVVNVTTDKTVYYAGQMVHATVTVDQNASVLPDSPAALEVSESVQGLSSASLNLTCAATGDAVCPTDLARSNNGNLTATIAPFTKNGRLTIKFDMPTSTYTTNLNVKATLSTGPNDQDTQASTNVALQSPTIADTAGDATAEVTAFPAAMTAKVAGDWTARYTNQLGLDTSMSGTAAFSVADGSEGPNITEIKCSTTGTPSNCNLDFGPPWVMSSPGTWTLPATDTADTVYFQTLSAIPAGESFDLTYTWKPIRTGCQVGADTLSTATLTTSIWPSYNEIDWGNNTAVQSTAISTPECGDFNLQTSLITLDQYGTKLGDPWQATWTFTNGGPALSSAVQYTLSATWGGFEWAGSSVATPTCVATGGAICPTSWSFAGGVPFRQSEISAITSSGPPIPAGGTVTITTGGFIRAPGPSCEIFYDGVMGDIRASINAAFPRYVGQDINTGQNETPAAGHYNGNNSFLVLAPGVPGMQADVNQGAQCGSLDLSGDIQAWADAAHTVPLSSPVPPGATMYLTQTFLNQAPGVPVDMSLNVGAFAYMEAIQGPTPRAHGLYNLDHFRCTATGGATCPTMPADGTYDITSPSFSALSHSAPPGGSVTLAYSVKLGTTISEESNGSTRMCLLDSDKIDQRDVFTFSASADAGVANVGERNWMNNSASLQYTIALPDCQTGLAVEKTVADPLVRRDGKTVWTVTVSNTGNVSLDVPRLVDGFWAGRQTSAPTPVAVETLSCTTTGGASCPSVLPSAPNQRINPDGSIGSSPPAGIGRMPNPFIDVSWTNGPDTMPAGSSVTFVFVTTMNPPQALDNGAFFMSDPTASMPFATVLSGASTYSPPDPSVGITKTVNPVKARPGQKVTFTVQITNGGLFQSENLTVADAVSQPLVATNPNGFTNVQCRPMTALEIGSPPVNGHNDATCPTITSDASGLNMFIPVLPASSGLMITYDAIAPMTRSSAENIASISTDPIYATSTELSAHANLLTNPITLTGTLWHDSDNSAGGTFFNIRTGSEAAVNPGMAVVMTDINGVVLEVTPLKADGTYLFENVPMDSSIKLYLTTNSTAPLVGEVFNTPIVPNGWANTTPLLRSLTTAQDDITEQDFGVRQPASISGHVIHDKNYDSVRNTGDVGIENVTVELLDSNGNVVKTQMTDADGAYTFTNLDPGTYSVREVQPAGYTDETLIVGTGATTAGGNGTANLFDSVVLSEGDNAVNYDFLEVKFYPVTITKFGLVNGTIGPIGGATFALYSTDPATAGATPVTDGVAADSAGAATFTSTGLRSGTDYWLVETQAPSGHQLLAQPVKFTVDDTGAITLANPSGLVKVDPDNASHLIVSDVIIPDMPLTGGNGPSLALFVLGLLLVVAATQRRRLAELVHGKVAV